MHLINFYHHHRLHRLSKHKDFFLFELSIWFHTLARSLISIFVPILLYETGFSITSIVFFFLIFNVIDVPLNIIVDGWIRKIGAKKGIILGTIATIAFFIVLGILTPENWILLLFLAFLAALYDTLFWISHIYIFFEANREGLDEGNSVGALESVRRLASVAGPLVGAFILLVFGESSLIAASVLIFIISIIPLFKMQHVRDIPKEKRMPMKSFFSAPQEKRDYFSMAVWGIHGEVDGTLLPLFVFLVFGSIESVAVIPVIVTLSSALFSYLAGKMAKKFGTRMIIVGSIVIFSTWILRILVQDLALFYVSVLFVGIFSLLVSIPLEVSIASQALKLDSLSAATYRNMLSMSLRIVLYTTLFFLIEVFKVSFIFAASSLIILILIVVILNSQINRSGILEKK